MFTLRANDSDMTDTAFRKIDIDAYDEDTFQESELYEADPRDPQMVLNDAKTKSTQVRTALSKSVPSFDRSLCATDYS